MQQIISFFDSNFFVAFVTLAVGFSAIGLYVKQRKDKKRDAASLILQEIRYAEQKIRNYNSQVGYQFHERLLPTDSWNANIHLFIKDFEETQIDLISSFYSKAHYIDSLIEKISDQGNNLVQVPISNTTQNPTTGGAPQGATQQQIAFQAMINPMTQTILNQISMSMRAELVYNTPVGERLKQISKKHWYSIL